MSCWNFSKQIGESCHKLLKVSYATKVASLTAHNFGGRAKRVANPAVVTLRVELWRIARSTFRE